MGHIAFSQRYAFEANEGMGNFSPRMLQRLVQTSLISVSYTHLDVYKRQSQPFVCRSLRFVEVHTDIHVTEALDQLFGAHVLCLLYTSRCV